MDKTKRDELIISLRKQDKTFRQIADEIGCGLGTVRKVIRAYPGNDIRKEQFTTAMTLEQARDKYCPDGFELLEYHPDQIRGQVKLKCKTCGYEFTKMRTSFCGANSKCKTHCPECDRQERETKHKQLEQLKEQREKEKILAEVDKIKSKYIEVINSMPTVNTEQYEIVHCKDCKWAKERETNGKFQYFAEYYCARYNMCQKSDFFCKSGEKKTDEEI